MNTVDISIIIPSHNGEPWLALAVESILLQEGPSWELIIVDDHSTDNSHALAQAYAQKDSRITCLCNAYSKGVSGTRNTGMDAARGTYITFFDCDDTLPQGALQNLHTVAKDQQAAIVRGRIVTFNALTFASSRAKLDGPDFQLLPATTKPHYNAAHMYNLNFLREHAIRFDEELHCSEDTNFLYRAYTLVESIPALTRPTYIYLLDHKAMNYSPNYILSLSFGLERTLAFLAGKNMTERLLPYAEFFVRKWLQQVSVVQAQPMADFDMFLQKGMACIASPHWDIRQALHAVLGDHDQRFLELCIQKNSHELMALLEKNHFISPPPQYYSFAHGIKPLQKFTQAYPRRLLNYLRNPSTRQCLHYLLKLRLKALLRKISVRQIGKAS